MAFLNWFQDNWFIFLQNLGTIGGLFFAGASLCFTAASFCRDAKERRIGNLFEATKQHREIWTTLYSYPGLKRVVNPEADLGVKPITHDEELFVKLLILHLASNFRASQAGMFTLRAEIHADIVDFFSLPIPREVWARMKRFQDKEFVDFVETQLVA